MCIGIQKHLEQGLHKIINLRKYYIYCKLRSPLHKKKIENKFTIDELQSKPKFNNYTIRKCLIVPIEYRSLNL